MAEASAASSTPAAEFVEASASSSTPAAEFVEASAASSTPAAEEFLNAWCQCALLGGSKPPVVAQKALMCSMFLRFRFFGFGRVGRSVGWLVCFFCCGVWQCELVQNHVTSNVASTRKAVAHQLLGACLDDSDRHGLMRIDETSKQSMFNMAVCQNHQKSLPWVGKPRKIQGAKALPQGYQALSNRRS